MQNFFAQIVVAAKMMNVLNIRLKPDGVLLPLDREIRLLFSDCLVMQI